MPNGTSPVPDLSSTIWDAIKNEDLVGTHWDIGDQEVYLHLGSDLGWYLDEDHDPLLVCPMNADDWSLIKGGTLEDNVISVGANSYQIHLERGSSSTTAKAKVRLVS
jgi:hypothetical protein